MAKSDELRHYPPIDTDEIESQLAQLEQELQQVRRLAEESDAALAALEEQRVEREGQLQLARRAEEDFSRRIDEKRVELRRAEAEAAIKAYERSVNERDSAAERFASAVQAAVAGLGEYKVAQESLVSAWEAIPRSHRRRRVRKGQTTGEPEREPTVVSETFELLGSIVRERVDLELERDLVEAAARSPMRQDIEKLPAHLQALARQRRLSIRETRRR